MNRTKIKICGLKRREDIEIINDVKPDFCGFIINFPKSHRSISPEKLRELVAGLDRKHTKAVGVFVDQDVKLVAELLNDGCIDMAQLHGSEDNAYIESLKAMTDKPIIKAFAVKNIEALKEASGSKADHILLDQGQGSGSSFDWSLLGSDEAKEIFDADGLPDGQWFLAGGLNSSNIEEAIRCFHPYAVDLSSAVETDEVKDKKKIKKIVDLVRKEK